MKHVLAGARVPQAAWVADLSRLKLPYLRDCFNRSTSTERVQLAPSSLSSGYEAASAHGLGWADDDGRYPWAAWEAGWVGKGAAWVSLCHWSLGQSHATLLPLGDLCLSEHEARALFETMAPYFLEDDITLRYDRPDRWLAQGDCFRRCASVSIERACRHVHNASTLVSLQPPVLQRLQSEMQMLLYQHPINEHRHSQGLAVVNAFHVSGCGAWEGVDTLCAQPQVSPTQHALAAAVNANDHSAWLSAWQALDETVFKEALGLLDDGHTVDFYWAGDDDYVITKVDPKAPSRWRFWRRAPHFQTLFLAPNDRTSSI